MAAGALHAVKKFGVLRPEKPLARATTRYVPGPLSSRTPTVFVLESGKSASGAPGSEPSGLSATLRSANTSCVNAPGLRSIGSVIVFGIVDPAFRVSTGVVGWPSATDAVIVKETTLVPAGVLQNVSLYRVRLTV